MCLCFFFPFSYQEMWTQIYDLSVATYSLLLQAVFLHGCICLNHRFISYLFITLLLIHILLYFLLASSEVCETVKKELTEMSKWPSVGI